MKPFRTLAVVGVVAAVTLGGGLFSELVGLPGNHASGETWMARGPSTLADPNGYASLMPHHPTTGYPAPWSYHPSPGYDAAPSYRPAPYDTPQSPSVPYGDGYLAQPAVGYGTAYPQAASYPQAAPYREHALPPYQPASARPVWPYVQSKDGYGSVTLQHSELPSGPPLASPQVQRPTTAPYQVAPYAPVPYQTAPMQHTPYHQMSRPQLPASAMPGHDDGAVANDVWKNGTAMCGPPPARNWFGGVGGVYMTRDHGDHYTFSFGTGSEADQRTNTRDADMDWTTGFDVRVGRYFNCQRNAVELVYWDLNPDSQSTQTVSADVLGNLNGILNWDSLTYGGNTADVYVNVAPGEDGIHRLTRGYAFQNAELNLWRFCGSCAEGKCGCSRLTHNWLAGVRYFRFDESLLFASDADDLQIISADDEIFYNIDLENQLAGFQVGNEAQYRVSERLTADLGLKLGVYYNQINHLSQIGGNLGIATINNGPMLGEQFRVVSSKDDIAFLGELNFGLRHCFTGRWTGTAGYRALAVTGVAVAADQIYPDLRGINDVANIDSSRALILHGGYAGVEYNW